MVVAEEEARMMQLNYIGSEHILLALIQCEGIAGQVLENLNMHLEVTRETILKRTGMGVVTERMRIPFTAKAKKILERSLREALQLGHDYIGTEHILLAILNADEGLGADILASHCSLKMIRQEVIRVLHGNAKKNEKTIENVLTVAPLSIPDRIDQLEVRIRIAEQMLGLR